MRGVVGDVGDDRAAPRDVHELGAAADGENRSPGVRGFPDSGDAVVVSSPVDAVGVRDVVVAPVADRRDVNPAEDREPVVRHHCDRVQERGGGFQELVTRP